MARTALLGFVTIWGLHAIDALAGNGAAFITQTVPTTMALGQTYPVSVTMKNTGDTTWTSASLYRLGSQAPQDNVTWGIGRVELPGSVAPGQSVTFNFNVTAPSAVGVVHFQWRMVEDLVEWFGDYTEYVAVKDGDNNAAIVSQNVPAVMTPGQSYPVIVTVQNTGNTTWTIAGQYRLGTQNPQDNLIWGLGRVELPNDVAPGGTVTFNFSVTAPSTVGTYNFQWQMVEELVEWFGQQSPNVAVKDGLNGAAFVSQNVPSFMVPGQSYPVSVTMQNNGTTRWTAASQYRLGSQNPQDNTIWGVGRVELPIDVAPGDTVTFNFNVTAPAGAGTYNFQWQMVQELVEWFGDQTPNVAVGNGVSVNDAVLDFQQAPTVMLPGQTYQVAVFMLNTGSTTWTAGSQYRLGAQNPQDNTVWGLGRVELPSDVQPGEEAGFIFNVTAPSTLGTYNFQWRMVQELVEWFGGYTDNIPVQVGVIDAATFIDQFVPTDMVPGAGYASIRMQNTGTTTWTAGNSYYLRGENPQDNTVWGLARIELPDDVAPGDIVEFDPTFTAPTTPGTYNLQWRMSHGSVEFGDFTDNVAVNVGLLNSARFVLEDGVPSAMTPGATYYPDITMFNNGTTTWTAGTYYLRAENPQDNSVWGFSRLELPNDEPPGSRVDFFPVVVAPTVPGTYNFQWRMSRDNVEFGDYTPNVVVQDSSFDGATFVSQNVPSTMVGGKASLVTITMQNSGTTTWTAGTYQLSSQNPQDNGIWGINRADLPYDVPPGYSVEIAFNVFPPNAGGTYNFQWRMFNGNVAFGDFSTPVVVQVTSGNNAAFLYQNVPTTMVAGVTYGVNVAMQNTGNGAWTSAGNYVLGSQNPQGNNVWGISSVPLPSDVARTDSIAFFFTVTAPAVPGVYDFQWQMEQQPGGWFGAPSSDVTVIVQPRVANPGNLTVDLSGVNDGDTVFEGTGLDLNAVAQEANPSVSMSVVAISIDGQIAATSSGGATQLAYEWMGIGIGMHAITATAIDVNGEVASATKTINAIIDPKDVPFRAILDGFKSSLSSGNKTAALAYLSPSAQSTFGPVFDALQSSMPQILAEWSPPRRISLSAGDAEFAVTRITPDGPVVYFISFVLDASGNWVIDSM